MAGAALTGVFGGLVDEVEYVPYLIKLRLRSDEFVQRYVTGSANHGQRHNGNRVREPETPQVVPNRENRITSMSSNHRNLNLGATPPRENARDTSQDPIPEAVIRKYGLPRRETRSQAAITKNIPYAFYDVIDIGYSNTPRMQSRIKSLYTPTISVVSMMKNSSTIR